MSTAAELTAPHRLQTKYLCSHHPGISFRREPAARVLVLSYWPLARLAVFETATSSAGPRRSLGRSNAHLHHTKISAFSFM